jgi:signal transduction histidine kinase
MPVAATDLLDQLLLWSEQEKAQLSREMHDDMGGMLVAAVMDLAWIEQRVGKAFDADSRAKFARVQHCIRSAIDLKRTLIEQLRPSLLDNFGLFAALRWLLGKTCTGAGIVLTQAYPEQEPHFTPEASIAIYRVLQAALALVLARASLDRADLDVGVERDEITFRLRGSSSNSRQKVRATRSGGRETFELAAMLHRMRALGGEASLARKFDCEDIAVTIRLPLDAAILSEHAVEDCETVGDF